MEPGKIGPPQVAGQYGFVAHIQVSDRPAEDSACLVGMRVVPSGPVVPGLLPKAQEPQFSQVHGFSGLLCWDFWAPALHSPQIAFACPSAHAPTQPPALVARPRRVPAPPCLQYICPIPGGFQEVKVPCKIRLNTLRDNRLGSPSWWPDMPTKDMSCGAPISAGPLP